MAENKKWGYEGEGRPFDRELSKRVLFGFVFGLALLVLLTILAMRGFFGLLVGDLERQDPAPSPIAEANLRQLPPEPRLEVHPTLALQELRAREDSILLSYGWEDREAGVARIPVERAMEIIARDGVPAWPAVDPAAEQGGSQGERGSNP
jgi:hypothetical protein